MLPLEFFGPDHGHEEVGEQQQRHDPDNQVLHKRPSHFFADADIDRAGDEERHDDSDID